GWHVAELDDAGGPVRLAAAPADLARILHALGAAGAATDTEAAGLPRLPSEGGPRSCLF
ncbi:PH domain-containing protein, partial [Streptomyces rubrogriseus]|nr:PH domain-containing protein [Streptomyces rubrogriseus]